MDSRTVSYESLRNFYCDKKSERPTDNMGAGAVIHVQHDLPGLLIILAESDILFSEKVLL